MLKNLLFAILLLISGIKIHANCVTGTVAAPVVDSITVDLAGNVTICWQPVPDPDIASYTIFMVNPVTGANDSINSVPSPTNCFTLPFGSNNSDIQTVELGVVGIDICDNPSPVGVNYHNTIHLSNTVDICAASINLTWNPYDDFNSGVNVLYNIFVSQNAGPFVLASSTNDTTYTYTGITQGTTYDFYVRAIENNGLGPITSSSNDIQINTINFLKDPAFNYLYTATVIDSQQINVQFYVDTTADISHYNINRKSALGDPYILLTSIPAYPGMNPLVTFIDNDVNANSTHYYYQIETINTCQDIRFTSNVGKTIWLYVESDGVGAKNTLKFTHYEDWLGVVERYDIYRAVGGIWDATPIASISSFVDTAVFQDDILTVTEGDGEFCYRIEAREAVTPHVGNLPAATSTSNESCAKHTPLLYVPNAFAPLSPYNYEFKPVLTFSNPLGYLLQIYNKWGQKIFETQDLNEGWNGTFENSGNICQTDSYVYVIKLTDAFGEEHKKRGVVSLLR